MMSRYLEQNSQATIQKGDVESNGNIVIYLGSLVLHNYCRSTIYSASENQIITGQKQYRIIYGLNGEIFETDTAFTDENSILHHAVCISRK